MFAAARGRTEVVGLLTSAGAIVDAPSFVIDIRRVAREDGVGRAMRDDVLATFQGTAAPGWQPSPAQVQAAVRAANEATSGSGTAPAQSEPIEADPDLGEIRSLSYADLVGGQGGLTALHYAVREGNAQTALRLVELGAGLDVTTLGDGTSPLLMAVLNGHFDLALELVARGADPNVTSHAGTGPLYAVINTQWAPKARYPQQRAFEQQAATYVDVAEALLDAGADPNTRLTKHLWYMEYTFSQLDVDTRGATPFWRAAYALDVPLMQMLVARGADPSVATVYTPPRRRGGGSGRTEDPSGLPPAEVGGPHVQPIHAATGHAYGTSFAGVSHTHAPDAWLPAVRYLVEELGADVNARDADGFSPLHWAASRGDNEVVLYLVERGADPTFVSRRGHTTADMANGPFQRITPFPETIALLESLGSKNNHNCVSC
jgi:ankyrin repeat protein